jgi:hypothetical protein
MTSPPAPLQKERGDQRSRQYYSITYAKIYTFYCFNLSEAFSFASIIKPRNFGTLLRRLAEEGTGMWLGL